MIKLQSAPAAIAAGETHRVSRPQAHFARRRTRPSWLVPRFLRVAATCLLAAFAALVPAHGQAFVAEWTAATAGGVGPTGMVLSTENGATYLYVSDHPRGRVHKFDTATGAVVATYGKQGNANGDFNQPYGLARDPATGDLYVAERGNHRISRITSAGTFVMAWGVPGSAAGQFNEPIGVAVDAAGDVYVTDHANHRVQKFRVAQSGGAWTATHLTTWGSQGSGNGQFNFPYGITADAAGNIWVADGFNGRVQKFDTSGTFQSVLGGPGAAPGQFIVATWVGVHPGGDLFVTSTNSNPQEGTLADASSQWVSRFTAAGAFVSRFGGAFGTAPGQFRLPFSAVIDAANRVYVSDYYNTRVQVFDLNAAPGTGTGGGTGGGTGPDTTAPTVASFTTGTATANAVEFTLTFSEAVTGVNAADFNVTTTGGATATIGAIAGNGAAYAIPVTFTGTGALQLSLNSAGTGIADPAGNALATGASAPVFTIGSSGGGNPGGGSTTGTHIVSVTPPPNATYVAGQTLIFSVRFNAPVTVTAATRSSDDWDDVSYAKDDKGKGGGKADKKDDKDRKDDDRDRDDDKDDDDDRDDEKDDRGDDDDDDRDRKKSDDDKDKDKDDDDRGNGPGHDKGKGNGNDGRNGSRGGDRDDDKDDDDDDDRAVPFFTWSAVVSSGQQGSNGRVDYVSGSGTDTLTFRYKIKRHDVARNGITLGTSIQVPTGASIKDGSGNVLTVAALTLPWTANPLPGVIIGSPVNGLTGKSSQVIVLKPVPGIGVGESITLTATTSSGLPVTWVLVSGNATLNGNVLTPKNKGAIVLRIAQPGDSRHDAVVTEMILEAREKRTDRLVNLSSRLRVTGGDASRAVVAGFVVTGSAPKSILIRAIGPGLAAFGIRDALAQPRLVLRDGTGRLIDENAGWANKSDIAAAFDRVGAFKLTRGSRDAAMLVSLAPGAYTAEVKASGNGIALIEVYDASTGTALETNQLVNISTRGFVDTGDGVLVAGFVVTGDTSKRVLIRGIGPGLAAFGVPGAVVDPVLTLFRVGRTDPIAQNNDWETAPPAAPAQPVASAAEISAATTAAGAFPLAAGSKDAALVVTLEPGSYSAVVRGSNNATGAGLIEIYEVRP